MQMARPHPCVRFRLPHLLRVVLLSLIAALSLSAASSIALPRPVHAAAIWTNVAAMHASRMGHTATLLPNGQVLVAGGRDGVAV